MKQRISFFPKQYEALTFNTQFGLVCAGSQGGKGLWEEEPVLTEAGYIPIKNIKPNDFLFDRNGNKTKVINVFHRGIQHCYEIEFTDKKKIIVDTEHLWVIIDPHRRKEQILSTTELLKRDYYWNKKKNNKCSVPAAKPIKFKSKSFLIAPYTLGILLGDGNFTTSLNVSTADKEVIDKIKSELPSNLTINKNKNGNYDYKITERIRKHDKQGYIHNAYIDELRKLKLFGLKSDKKFIPDIYKYSSIKQRLNLLRGLMDSDGYIKKHKNITFYSTSKQLRDGIIFIIESLGGKAWYKLKYPEYKYNNEIKKGKICYEITFIFPLFNPFHLERKANKYFIHKHTANKHITNIKYIGKRKSVCLQVDSPTKTFIAKNQIVMHNTFLGACWSAKKIDELKGVGAIIAPNYKILQQSTLQKFFGLFPQYRKYHKEQKGVIEISDTNKIFVRSADNPLGLEGLTLNWAWLDEAGMMSRLVWNVIRARVSITQGQVLITTTPYSMNWIYDDFYIPWKNKTDKALSFFSWKSTDNKRFSQEYFEAERKRMRPEEFARRYCGEFKKMHGLVYNLNEKQVIDTRRIEGVNYICGIDWGYKNPSAIIILGITPNAVYVVDEWKETEKTTAEIIEVLKHYISLYNLINIYPDPAEPDRIKELLNAGIQSNSVSKDIKGGVSYIQQLIKENKLFVFKKCKYFLDEINSYHYHENKNIDVPVKSNDHLLDAFRYAIFSYQLNKRTNLTDYVISG